MRHGQEYAYGLEEKRNEEKGIGTAGAIAILVLCLLFGIVLALIAMRRSRMTPGQRYGFYGEPLN